MSKIGANEGGSGSFVCDFVVEDLRAAMQALHAFRGMVLDKASAGEISNNDKRRVLTKLLV